MHYANPHFSLLVSVTLGVSLFYLWAARRRERFREKFAEKKLAESISPSLSPRRRSFKTAATISAVALIMFALMQPQWGFEWKEVKRTGLDMLIAIDVSKSMLATDVKPNRLERSKFAVKDLIKKLNSDRVGLIAFAGTAFLQCPLTIDYNGFLLALDDLSTMTIPRGSTSLYAAIKEALDAFKGPEKKYKVLVLITDGEELEGDAMKIAATARDAGIKIYCVGVGTADGELIPVIGEDGERAYLADRGGKTVKTRLNEDLLKKIAISTGGSYVRATQNEFGLTLLYDKSISKLEKRDIEANIEKNYTERFQIFLAIAVIILLIEPLIAERKRAVL